MMGKHDKPDTGPVTPHTGRTLDRNKFLPAVDLEGLASRVDDIERGDELALNPLTPVPYTDVPGTPPIIVGTPGAPDGTGLQYAGEIGIVQSYDSTTRDAVVAFPTGSRTVHNQQSYALLPGDQATTLLTLQGEVVVSLVRGSSGGDPNVHPQAVLHPTWPLSSPLRFDRHAAPWRLCDPGELGYYARELVVCEATRVAHDSSARSWGVRVYDFDNLNNYVTMPTPPLGSYSGNRPTEVHVHAGCIWVTVFKRSDYGWSGLGNEPAILMYDPARADLGWQTIGFPAYGSFVYGPRLQRDGDRLLFWLNQPIPSDGTPTRRELWAADATTIASTGHELNGWSVLAWTVTEPGWVRAGDHEFEATPGGTWSSGQQGLSQFLLGWCPADGWVWSVVGSDIYRRGQWTTSVHTDVFPDTAAGGQPQTLTSALAYGNGFLVSGAVSRTYLTADPDDEQTLLPAIFFTDASSWSLFWVGDELVPYPGYGANGPGDQQYVGAASNLHWAPGQEGLVLRWGAASGREESSWQTAQGGNWMYQADLT